MERLTSRCGAPLEGTVLVRERSLGRAYFESERDYKDYRDALNKLAAYEDTGLEPEEIEARQDVCLWIPEGRFSEIISAEAEGRLVVLPCKVGDTVYIHKKYNANKGKIITKVVETTVKQMMFDDQMNIVIAGKMASRGLWGDRVFGSREEAERALEVSG